MAITPEAMRPALDDTDDLTRGRIALVGDAISGVADSAATAAGDALSRLPAIADTTRSALAEANRQIHTGSDEILIVGSALSLGFAMGLWFGGAPRLAVAGAMLPAASMGLTILERANRGWLERSGRAHNG